MALPARARGVVLLVSLIATLAAVKWVGSRDHAADDFAPVARADVPLRVEPAVVPSPAPAAPAEAASAATAESPQSRTVNGTEIDLARLKREIRPAEEPVGDAFSRHTWYVAPPPPKPAPSPKPMAPALPFKFMGRLADGAKEVVFITNKQDRNYAVSPGDTIDGTYRVDSITERSMTLTFLPLGQQQTLQLTEGN